MRRHDDHGMLGKQVDHCVGVCVYQPLGVGEPSQTESIVSLASCALPGSLRLMFQMLCQITHVQILITDRLDIQST